jgi:hypothetical protein
MTMLLSSALGFIEFPETPFKPRDYSARVKRYFATWPRLRAPAAASFWAVRSAYCSPFSRAFAAQSHEPIGNLFDAPSPSRCATALPPSHENVFLLSKSRRYFFDADAIAVIIRARIAFVGLTGARTLIAATTLSGRMSAGNAIVAMSGTSGASRPPKRTMQRFPLSSPGAAFWPVQVLVIWSSVPSSARGQSARSVKNCYGDGSGSTCRLSTVGLPDPAPSNGISV